VLTSQVPESEVGGRKELKVKKWDSAAHLKTEADIARYWEACLQEGRDAPAFITAALGNIARARGMTGLALRTGLTREGLHKALSPDGNPKFSTVMRVIQALGLELHGASARQ
jgi:probable addiction module antidote protein